MHCSARFDRWVNTRLAALFSRYGQLIKFCMVGGSATLLYAILSLWLHARWGMGALVASFLAYCFAALLSYIGHYIHTFRSQSAHRKTAPLFASLSLIGYAISLLAPWWLVNQWGLPMIVPVIFTSLAVPLINYLLLKRMVFLS